MTESLVKHTAGVCSFTYSPDAQDIILLLQDLLQHHAADMAFVHDRIDNSACLRLQTCVDKCVFCFRTRSFER